MLRYYCFAWQTGFLKPGVQFFSQTVLVHIVTPMAKNSNLVSKTWKDNRLFDGQHTFCYFGNFQLSFNIFLKSNN
jgi:hypothetical protein